MKSPPESKTPKKLKYKVMGRLISPLSFYQMPQDAYGGVAFSIKINMIYTLSFLKLHPNIPENVVKDGVV